MEGGGAESHGGKIQRFLLVGVPLLAAHALFQRKVTKDLDVEIAATEEALAHAYKMLQDLKTTK